ncbi:cilia- and flagella-associated protein 46 isoform X2 [Melanotaenia boesemani]|uniref:cilia- and flagella-associated protein 46 isoform X2 n=1 Tax=Melanotaenia boesemani TaxID=1250792 RepID=UPI001C04C64B|nr:cilia- and flagella-associated protein 46 isoform X2 [Melanotaenia boesemani]
MDLDIRECLAQATENQDSGALQSAYRLIAESTVVVASRLTPRIASDLYVICAEAALQLGHVEISTACLKIYFQGNPPANQFLCRALLCKGQLKSPPATGSVEDFEEAVMYFLKAIEISKAEPRYHFLVFNASVLYFQTVRPLLLPGRCLHLVPSFKQVVQSLEDVADQDYGWRAELRIHLLKCLVDSGEVEDTAGFAKVTEEFINTHTPHLYPRFYTVLVQHKLFNDEVLLEMSQQCSTLAVIYKMQKFKSWIGINGNKLTKEDFLRLEEIFWLLVDCTKTPATPVNSRPPQSPTPIQSSDRVAFLLELALLALQVKHQKVVTDCLKELKSAGQADIGQRIIMDCVNCELNLLKKEAKMNDYSKASVEAHLKEIDKLDQWLKTAVREGGPQAVQAVCVTQWSICLPLLQHNLRKRIRTPLLKLAQALEDIHSMLLEVRCQVHSELAIIEEEEGCLEASLTHLQKAMLLDNGTQRERLSSAFNLLELRRNLYHTPNRAEDKAAMLMHQTRDLPPGDNTDTRPILVSVGLLLAPLDFQMVLDADDISKIPWGSPGSEPAVRLATKAQHHSTCVQRVGAHLARQEKDKDSTERAKLWAMLAKIARKKEVWDVCRAACRFCLLYDDGRWKISKTDKCKCTKEESGAPCCYCRTGNQTCVHLLRLLAEICFINAEATIHKLLTEGVQLNSPAVPPQEGWVGVPEDNPHWAVYRDWIQALSAYATSNFLRAGELGAEIGEPWVVANAAIYLWNYNSHLLAAGEFQLLLPTFQSLVEKLRRTKDIGNRALCVLLCNAVAQGLMQPLSERESAESAPAGDKMKKGAEMGMDKAASAHGVLLDPAAVQNAHMALEMCNYALRISSCQITGETVPIAVRKQVLTTWVQIKRLLKQQIGPKLDVFKNECGNDEVSSMTRVLVGVEMLRCNRNPGHMESSIPSLSALVSLASECSWSDAVVELQVWCQLAAFCHHVKDHSLVLRCTRSALQLGEAATKSLNTTPYVLYGPTAVKEMLSRAACLRGLSLVHESSGDLDTYKEALNMLLSSVSFAEKADNQTLCVRAAVHYWNTCLPLTQIPEERSQLKDHLEKILNALIHTTKHDIKQSKVKGLLPLIALPRESSSHGATIDEEDLALRAAIYNLLLHIHTDKADFESALQLLDKAVKEMPRTRHRLSLLKCCILVKARLGKNILLDMQNLRDEEGQSCSLMWHQAAMYADTINQQLTYYQKSITSLMSTESQWQKVSILLEFAEWLFCHDLPKVDARLHVQWAIDILLQLQPKQVGKPEDESEKNASSVDCESLAHGSFIQNFSNLKEVCCLDQLVQAYTLLAVISEKTSSDYQLNLLRAYNAVLRIWQVSEAVACEISSEMAKSQSLQPPVSAGSKKGKDKGKGKKPTPTEERHRPVVLDQTLPPIAKDWACYVCPDQARQIFRTNTSPHCINTHSITKQTQSLFYLTLLETELHSISLDHLTLPILHLAETIAHDLLDRRSLSNLYRLRIVRTCVQLGLESHSLYQEKVQSLSEIEEQEQIGCHKAIALSQERRTLHKAYNQAGVGAQASYWRQTKDVSALDIWLDKAEVCISMGLYQSARQLLAEAHMVARELGDEKAISRSLLSLASLACEEQNYAQALILLDEAQTLGGDHGFWYQLTLTKVKAVTGQRDQNSQIKTDQIIKQGCEALQLALGQRANRRPELTFMIASLERRGAVEYIHAISGGEPGETLTTEALQRLIAACDTLRECTGVFSKLSCKEQAAETHGEYAHSLRLLAAHVTDREKKQRFLLDSLAQMQLAVTLQQHVVLNAQSLFRPQESHDLSLAAMRRLLSLRLTLAEFCLDILEEHCAEETCQALARTKKTSAEIVLEEYTRSPPEPNTTEEEWVNVGRTLGQMVQGQLAAVGSHTSDNMNIRARCLSLMGKYLRLLAVQEEPVYLSGLWFRHNQKEAWSDPNRVPTEDECSEKDSDSSRKELDLTSARSAEPQRKCEVQQLLAEASIALSEAISLCLQHNLSSSILADASLNMLECHGQSDPAVAGQCLALFQSCCTVSMAAEVLSSACHDTSVSKLSALLCIRRNLLLSQEGRPSSMLKGVEDSLSSLSKVFSHLTISSNHLSLLSELPPNLKILLLQHSEDGSYLYGGFYETNKAPEDQKGKTMQGTLTCSRVAKVSVCPQALLALREQALAFSQDSRHSLLQEDSQHSVKGWLETSEEHQNTARDAKLALCFREIVQDMEDYLNPLLTQFDFSCIRPQAASLPISEVTKTKDKEEKGISVEPAGEHLVILADRKLLELPLESLSVLQKEGVSSVSRDFSLQLFHSRLIREEPQKVESDNKKETKGGRGTKGKGDQSQTIKAVPASHASASYTFPVDTYQFKYIVDEESCGGTSLCKTLKEVLETHSHLSEGFMGSSLAEIEQVLCRSSAFIYLGKDHFMANIPPAKLAALNLSECRMALLFDRVWRKARVHHPSNLSYQKSDLTTSDLSSVGRFSLEKPLETALLLSWAGVGCIVLNQWHSSLQQNSHNAANVLDNLLRVRRTSGQTVHALRRGTSSEMPHHKVTVSHDEVLLTDSKEDELQYKSALQPSAFNCVLYGLPNLIVP